MGLLPHLHAHQLLQQPTIAVFCSADNKAPLQFKKIAYGLGLQLAKHDFGLVTGGSQTGLMKEVVDGYSSAAKNLSNLHGVIPQVFLPFNVQHPAIPKENIQWVESLHIRLQHFHDLAHAIIILPGGFGTLHELMDFLVHNQLFDSKKRIILLNHDDFWSPLLQQFHVMQQNALLTNNHLEMISVVTTIDECIEKLTSRDQHDHQNLESCFWEKE